MPGTPVPFPLSALPGARPGEGQGDLENVYAIKVGDEISHRRVPGLRRFTTPTPSSRTPRGQLVVDNYLLSAWTGVLERTLANGVTDTITGALAGSSRVTMARNIRPSGAQVVVVSEIGTYIVDPFTGTLETYPNAAILADYPNSAANLGQVESVDYYAGYLIFTRRNGTIVASGLQNAGIPNSSYGVAQYAADDLLRVLNNGETVLLFGTSTIEVWQDVGTSPFPLARAAVVDVGLLAKFCVAGGAGQWERGVLFIAADNTVRRLDGYNPVIVSNQAVERDIASAWRSPGDINCSVYVSNGQSFFTIKHPDWCWELNVGTGAWHRRKSQFLTTWRASWPIRFDNHWLAQDAVDDGLVEITHDVYDEVGRRLVCRSESLPLKDFPASLRVPLAQFDFTVGVGSLGGDADPEVMISWSFNGGASWSNPLSRSLGKEGEYGKLISVRNLGRSTHHGLRLRWEISDPVPVTFRGALLPTIAPSRARANRGATT
jgi:hypothetical protein